MTQVEFLQDQKARCLKWLATPETELPGKLTHKIAADLLDKTEDELLEFACLIVGNGSDKLAYVDEAQS